MIVTFFRNRYNHIFSVSKLHLIYAIFLEAASATSTLLRLI